MSRVEDHDGGDFLAPLVGGDAEDGGFGDLGAGGEGGGLVGVLGWGRWVKGREGVEKGGGFTETRAPVQSPAR